MKNKAMKPTTTGIDTLQQVECGGRMMVVKVMFFCLADYSVRFWSRPPRGTAPLPLEERQRALTSRLWGHSEYSDPSDWSLECPVSTASCGGKNERKEVRDKGGKKWCSESQVWMVIGWGGEEMNHRLELILLLDATQWHTNAHMNTFSRNPPVLLSDTQTVRAVDESTISLSVLLTAEIQQTRQQEVIGYHQWIVFCSCVTAVVVTGCQCTSPLLPFGLKCVVALRWLTW